MPSRNEDGEMPALTPTAKNTKNNKKEEEEDSSSAKFFDANEETQNGKKEGNKHNNDDASTPKDKNRPAEKEKIMEVNGSNGTFSNKQEETEEEYRLRVYGTTNTTNNNQNKAKHWKKKSSSSRPMRRLSLQLSSSLHKQYIRRKSTVIESLPDTPAGWIHFITTASSILLAYELQLQKKLTSPPHVFKQSSSTPTLDSIYNILTGPTKEEGILSRDIQPMLGIGTRGVLASTLAYLHLGPSSSDSPQLDKEEQRCSFREIMTMSADGAQIAIDWEIPSSPISPYPSSLSPRQTLDERKHNVLHGPITQPVVFIMHGINNDASFGYMKSLMRACTDRGWIAAGMNFRGMGGMELKTPRGYNGAYTGDLRCVVHKITSRMTPKGQEGDGEEEGSKSPPPPPPLFLVGNSLGANILTKYLGEEGIANTLPSNVAGGISLGNPLHIHSGNVPFPWNILLSLGVKKTYLEHLPTFLPLLAKDPSFLKAYLQILFTKLTIGDVDHVASTRLIRNQNHYPYMTRVGYKDGEDYWNDASSYHHVPHINVPFLKLTAQDDFLVYGPSLRKLSRSLENPNVLVVKTKCGGHLGWQESPPPPPPPKKKNDGKEGSVSKGSFAASWSDAATTDFIDAVIRVREMKWREDMEHKKRKEKMEKEAKKAAEDNKKWEEEHQVMQRRAKGAVIQAATVDASKIRSRL